MRVEYINPFVETSFQILKEVLGGADVKRGDLYLKSTAMPVMGVAALVGLAGDVEGRVAVHSEQLVAAHGHHAVILKVTYRGGVLHVL